MNDPNGFHFEAKGRYGLFYQFHELSGDTSHLSWRRAVSKDLVSYRDKGVVLSPKHPYEGIDSSYGGCWSGSYYQYRDEDYLVYTAADGPQETCCLAKKDYNGLYHQIDGNPIAVSPSFIQDDSFRDPYAFEYQGHSYFIIGAMDYEKHGKIFLYELRGEEAIYKGIFHHDDKVAMFECPCLLFLGEDVLLISSPMGLKQQGLSFQNSQNNIGILGHIDEDMHFVPHGEPFDLDFGFDYYAAQGCGYPMEPNKAVVTAWLSLWGKDYDHKIATKKDGYLGAMALPRLLSIEEEKLIQRPYPDVYRYFEKEGDLTGIKDNLLPGNALISFEGIEGPLKVSLLENVNGEVGLTYDPSTKILEVRIKDERDKARDGMYCGDTRKVYLENGLKSLDIFIDHYIVEIFVNDGEKVGSLMYWGNKGDEAKVRFEGQAKASWSRFSNPGE